MGITIVRVREDPPMLSRLAGALVPAVGRLTVTTDSDVRFAPGSIIAANHSSLADPAVVLAALRRLGVEPVVLAAAGLWRIPRSGVRSPMTGTFPSTGTTPAPATPSTAPPRPLPEDVWS